MSNRTRSLLAGVAAFLACLIVAAPAGAGWAPAGYVDVETLEIRTQEEGADAHWFPVWLVVIDGQVYVRLGNRAASRVENNVHKPRVSVRIANEEFESVETEPVPEMADRVADSMAEKYWSDIFVRFFPHPLTVRLSPAGS
jgi:hypothetical protein